jgi:hypothetical protein
MTPDQGRSALYDAQVTVTDRPASLGAVHRPAWRVPVCALLVQACRGHKAKREQLIVLNWAVRSAECAEALVAYLAGEAAAREVGVRYEPALVRAVNIAVGTGVLTVDGDYVRVTGAGEALLAEVAAGDLYDHERRMLAMLRKGLPVGAAEDLLRGGS